MAQQQKAPKKPQDAYTQRGKSLASAVQRLRGWVGSDPSRVPELADALVELTAHRLRGHAYALAAPDAQEAVRTAAQLLAATGPIGPYTAATDAARCVTTLVHVATLQLGVGLVEAAGRTAESWQDLDEQLRDVGIEVQLRPDATVWAAMCRGRVALAAGNTTAANAHADLARDRLFATGLDADPEAAFVAIDVDRLVSDCRWAAGRAEEALVRLHEAKTRYDGLVDERLQEPGRLSPALLERLTEPLFGLYRDMADRLAAIGDLEVALVVRRTLVETLTRVSRRLGESVRVQLALALADLADDLLAADRIDEADAAATEGAAVELDPSGEQAPRLLVLAALGRTLTRAGRAGEAVTVLRPVVPSEVGRTPSAAQAVALLALAEALRAAGDQDAAGTVAADAEVASRVVLHSLGQDAADRTTVEDVARGVVSRGEVGLSSAGSGESAPTSGEGVREDQVTWLAAERAEARRHELEREERARAEAQQRAVDTARAEKAAAERLAAERLAAEQAERLERERLAAAEEEERVARKRRREERLESHRREVERLEAERLAEELAEQLAADPDEAERLELERLQAELAELERAEALARGEGAVQEPTPQERAVEPEAQTAPEPEPQAERVPEAELPSPLSAPATAEAEEAPSPTELDADVEQSVVQDTEELMETERRVHTEQRVDTEQPVHTEPREAPVEADASAGADQDELAPAQRAWEEARDRGDRRAARAANERVVELLRRRAGTDPAEYGALLRHALEQLSSARLRGGDVFGSRAAAREARALAKTLAR